MEKLFRDLINRKASLVEELGNELSANYDTNWRHLADKMKKTLSYIHTCERSDNPGKKLLLDWSRQKDTTVKKLLSLLDEINRDDVAGKLREAITGSTENGSSSSKSEPKTPKRKGTEGKGEVVTLGTAKKHKTGKKEINSESQNKNANPPQLKKEPQEFLVSSNQFEDEMLKVDGQSLKWFLRSLLDSRVFNRSIKGYLDAGNLTKAIDAVYDLLNTNHNLKRKLISLHTEYEWIENLANWTRVAIVIAKDHEVDRMIEVLESCKLVLKPVEELNQYYRFFYNGMMCYVIFLDDIGWDAAYRQTMKGLQDIAPNYITVCGSGGGRTKEVNKVWIIEQACYFDSVEDEKLGNAENLKVTLPIARGFKPERISRIARRNDGGPVKVFTTRDKSTGGPKKIDDAIEKYKVELVEMEIAAVWLATYEWNKTHPPVTICGAVKAISHHGSDKDRDENFDTACKLAAQVLLEYLPKFIKPFI